MIGSKSTKNTAFLPHGEEEGDGRRDPGPDVLEPSRGERRRCRPSNSSATGTWITLSWREVGEIVREVALGLIALGREKGDAVALLSTSRAEWVQADFAIFSAGCITVPVYPSYPPELIAYVVNDSGARTLIVEDAAQLAKALEVRDSMKDLEQIVVMAGYEAPQPPKMVMTWDALRRLGRDRDEALRSTLADRVASTAPEDIATIVYTSGNHGTAQGRGPDPRQPHGGPGLVEADHARGGAVGPSPVPAPRALLRAAGVVPRRPPGADHGLRGEHRQARREPARGAPALHLQRAARVREGVRAHPRRRGGGPAGQAPDLPLGPGRRARGEPAPAAGQAHPRGTGAEAPARPQAGVLEAPGGAGRPAGVGRLRGGAALPRDRGVLPRGGHPGAGGLWPHRDVPGGDLQSPRPLSLRLRGPGSARSGAEDRPGRRNPHPRRQRGHARLLQAAPGHRRRSSSPAGGSTAGTSDAWTTTGSSSSPTARRTSSSPRAGSTSRPRTSRTCSRRIRSSARSWSTAIASRTRWPSSP